MDNWFQRGRLVMLMVSFTLISIIAILAALIYASNPCSVSLKSTPLNFDYQGRCEAKLSK